MDKPTEKQILYIIKDSQGHQLSAPNPDDGELWDRVSSMEARGRRGLSVVVYTGKKESCGFAKEFKLYENLWDVEITSTEEKLIDLFWDGIRDYSSDLWFDSSTKEKEEILWWALERLEEPINRDRAIELFWEWADGLEDGSFIDFDLNEESKRA